MRGEVGGLPELSCILQQQQMEGPFFSPTWLEEPHLPKLQEIVSGEL